MDEPTVPEMIRALQADVRELVSGQAQYVTKEIMELKLQAVSKEQETLKAAQATQAERITAVSRWIWSGVVAPVIVGIILFVLLGKAP